MSHSKNHLQDMYSQRHGLVFAWRLDLTTTGVWTSVNVQSQKPVGLPLNWRHRAVCPSCSSCSAQAQSHAQAFRPSQSHPHGVRPVWKVWWTCSFSSSVYWALCRFGHSFFTCPCSPHRKHGPSAMVELEVLPSANGKGSVIEFPRNLFHALHEGSSWHPAAGSKLFAPHPSPLIPSQLMFSPPPLPHLGERAHLRLGHLAVVSECRASPSLFLIASSPQ